MSVEDGRKPPRVSITRIENPEGVLDHLINSGIDHMRDSARTLAELRKGPPEPDQPNELKGLVELAARKRAQPDWLNGQPKSLKALRMWHWRQVLANRAEQNKFEKLLEQNPEDGRATRAHHRRDYQNIANMARDAANLHLSAVQVLNDSLPGTAEQDCAKEDAHVSS